jgi:hypothetical protein
VFCLSGEMTTFEYSQFLSECIKLARHELHWIVDQSDFVDQILPSFLAEAVALAGLHFPERIRKGLKAKTVDEKLSMCRLCGIFAGQDVLTSPPKDMCLTYECLYGHGDERCERGGLDVCYTIGESAREHFQSKVAIKHADMSALWYLLLSYAVAEVESAANLTDSVTAYVDAWLRRDGFSLFASLPHLPEYRSSVAQSKKRLIYVPGLAKGAGELGRELGLGDWHKYVKRFALSPSVPLPCKGTEKIRVLGSLLAGDERFKVEVDKAGTLLNAAVMLFEASCGHAETGFVGRKMVTEKAVRLWHELLDDLFRDRHESDMDYGIFDHAFVIGSTKLKSGQARGVVVLYPTPDELAAPFEIKGDFAGLDKILVHPEAEAEK